MVESFIGIVANTADKFDFGMTRAYGAGCGGYKVSIAGRVPTSTSAKIWSKDTSYLLQVGAKKPGAAPIRLDINPGGLTIAGLSHIREMMHYPFILPPAWWEHARVSRVDAAVDLVGVHLGPRLSSVAQEVSGGFHLAGDTATGSKRIAIRRTCAQRSLEFIIGGSVAWFGSSSWFCPAGCA